MQTCRVLTAEWEVAMREKGSVRAFCAATAAIGATVLASSSARAVPLARSFGLKAAIHQTTIIQEARYICRGRHGRRCYYVSRPEHTLRYERPYTYRYERPYTYGIDPNAAIYHYWASPANN